MAEKVHIPDVVEPDEKLPRDLVALRRFAQLMDGAFPIPGTRQRFGLDALLGLVPGIGDVVAGLMSTWIIAGALRHRVPALVVGRMVLNIAVDLLFGSVPVAGDLFDFLFDENVRNMRLLEKYRDRRRTPRTGASVALIVVAVAVLLAAIPLLVVGGLVVFLLHAAGRLW